MTFRERQAALERARLGDSQALGELLQSFQPYLRVLVRAVGNGRLRARLDDSDVIQEALLAAHQDFGRFRGTTVAELGGWFRPIALRSANWPAGTCTAWRQRPPARSPTTHPPVWWSASGPSGIGKHWSPRGSCRPDTESGGCSRCGPMGE